MIATNDRFIRRWSSVEFTAKSARQKREIQSGALQW